MRRQVFLPSKQTETKLRILHAVDRPIDQMTTTMICERAGVSRQLFYRYFDSKFDLPFWYTVECDRISISEIGRSLTWMEGLEDFFTLISEEKESLMHFAKSKESQASRHQADERRAQILRETLAQYKNTELTSDLCFFIDSYANTFNKAFARWTQAGMGGDPVHIVYELVPPPLRDAVEPTR